MICGSICMLFNSVHPSREIKMFVFCWKFLRDSGILGLKAILLGIFTFVMSLLLHKQSKSFSIKL